ncbi:MAG: hypothetical protein GXO28_05775, partial [Methanopyri archaeon]|nr:hypothetical protein [Methanopyri archaeon]
MAEDRKRNIKDLLGGIDDDDFLRSLLGEDSGTEPVPTEETTETQPEEETPAAPQPEPAEEEEESKIKPLSSQEAAELLEHHEEAPEEGKILDDNEIRTIIEYPDRPVPIYVSKLYKAYYDIESLRKELIKKLGSSAP